MRTTTAHRSRWAALGLLTSSIAMLGLVLAPSQAASAAQSRHHHNGHGVVQTKLDPLNNSGVQGRAVAIVRGRTVTVRVDAHGLVRNAPHAMHFHFSADSTHMCPTVRDDSNADHRLSTSEGIPAYGAVVYSLTKSGDTRASSALAVDRFPTANRGRIHYHRTFQVTRAFAAKIRHGKVAVVVHGIDYNQNNTYDFSAGKSDLDPSLPTEATDPVACGVLK